VDAVRRGGPPPPDQLRQRDLDALRWVGDQYACRLDQLQVLLGRLGDRPALSASAARSVVSRWEALGLAGQGRFIAGEPPWVWLTHQGLRQAGLGFRVWAPKPWTLPHTFAVNRVRLFVEPRRPGARWRPERELRAASGSGPGGPVPDAEIHDTGGNVIAVEVELSPKSPARRRRVMQALVARYDSIWYFASADCWVALHDAACHVPPQLADLVRIYALEDV
jgi:hypothetical protein